MPCLKIACVLLVCVSFTVFGTAQSGAPAAKGTAATCRPASSLAADAEQIANEIGVMPLVQRVRGRVAHMRAGAELMKLRP
jgi:hypothetical protein